MQRIRLDGSIKRQKSWVFCAILCFLVLFDQLTKLYFHANFKVGEGVVVIPDFFSFALSFNEGAAWSFLADKEWGQLFFKILTPVFLILLVAFYIFYSDKSKWLKIALIFVFAGTIGNYIDRLCFSYVVDFLAFKIWLIDFSNFTFYRYNFPTFNIADCCLVVGAFMIIIYFLFLDKDALLKIKKNEK